MSSNGQYSILTMMVSASDYDSAKEIDRLALAHKIVHTFEKMDAINPTFELIDQICYMKIR